MPNQPNQQQQNQKQGFGSQQNPNKSGQDKQGAENKFQPKGREEEEGREGR